jgi:hypothetical protein
MEATRLKSISRAFVLHPEQIRRIVEIMEEGGKKAELKVSCAGDFLGVLSLKPSSIQELMTIPNIGDYKIKTLEMVSWGTPVISATFSVDTGPPISLYVSGEDAEVLKTYERLRRETSQACRDYWPTVDVFLIYPFLGMIVGSAGVSVLSISGSFMKSSSLRAFTENFLLSYFLIAVTATLLLWVLRAKVYPKGIFLIGAGVQEYESVKNRRQQLSIWAVVAGLVAAAVFAIIEHWLRF